MDSKALLTLHCVRLVRLLGRSCYDWLWFHQVCKQKRLAKNFSTWNFSFDFSLSLRWQMILRKKRKKTNKFILYFRNWLCWWDNETFLISIKTCVCLLHYELIIQSLVFKLIYYVHKYYLHSQWIEKFDNLWQKVELTLKVKMFIQ